MVDLLVNDDRSVDPHHLTGLLSVGRPGVEVTSVTVLSDSEGSASRLRLAVEYADGTGGGLPPTMFLKRNLARFTFPVEMYTTEVRLYRDVLPLLDIERPAVYAIEAADDDIRFTILMEDLGSRAGARLGIVTDPATPDEVDSVLATLARLHATWWGGARLGRELPWLTAPTSNPAMRFWAEIGPQLTRRHLEAGHRAELLDPHAWPPAALWSAFDRMVRADAEGPHTLLHGDVHAGNVYYVHDGDRCRGGLLDWQLALRGCWALDVTYLLVSALDPGQRATHERELLAGYLDRLAAFGIDAPAFDDAWRRYRQNVLYGIVMWLITPDGVHADEVQDLSLQRCLRAGEELETIAALR